MNDFVARRILFLHVCGAALCAAPFFIVETHKMGSS